jgi:DNA-binding beta-propeller fold protein YncE
LVVGHNNSHLAEEVPVTRYRRIVLLLLVAAAAALPATQHAPARQPAGSGELKLLKPFEVGGTGSWDYPLVDSAGRRLYIARATRVMVVDLDKGTLLGEVEGVTGAHGIAIVPDRNLGFATAGKDNAVVVFDLKTLKTVRKIPTGKGPDAILYDPASKKVFAICHGGGNLTVIDPSNLEQSTASLDIGGALEAGVADGSGRIFVNVEDKNECVAIDSKQLKVIARWKLGTGATPTGIAIDPVRKRIFVGCRSKHMVILDAENGKVLATLPIGAGVDGVVYDPELGALSANGKDANITVVRENPPGTFSVVQTVKTYPGAKTIALDPKTHQVYLPANVPGAAGNTFGVAIVGRDPEGKK